MSSNFLEDSDPVWAVKLAAVERIVLQHPEYERAKAQIARAIKLTAVRSVASCLVIYGEAGAGKTTLCQSVVDDMGGGTILVPGYVVTNRPAFYFRIPARISIDPLMIELLRRLGDPAPESGRPKDKEKRLRKLFQQLGVRLVIMDEFQHLFAANNSDVDAVRNWLKVFIDENQVTLILAGMPACDHLISSDKQISRRFDRRVHLGGIALFSEGGSNTPFATFWSTYMAEVGKRTGLEVATDATTAHTVMRIFLLTAAYPGAIRILASGAAEEPLLEGSPVLNLEHLNMASRNEALGPYQLTPVNPFDMSDHAVEAALVHYLPPR